MIVVCLNEHHAPSSDEHARDSENNHQEVQHIILKPLSNVLEVHRHQRQAVQNHIIFCSVGHVPLSQDPCSLLALLSLPSRQDLNFTVASISDVRVAESPGEHPLLFKLVIFTVA